MEEMKNLQITCIETTDSHFVKDKIGLFSPSTHHNQDNFQMDSKSNVKNAPIHVLEET